MNKVYKSIKAFLLIARNPYLLNKILDEDREWNKYVAKKFSREEGFPVIRPEALFAGISETVSPYAYLDGGSLPTDLALLKMLARSIPGCKYFEIGTWRGESVANVAQVASECVTLNLSAEEMKAMGLESKYIDQHGMYSKQLPNVRHLDGNTRQFDFRSLEQKFDLVFIDGDHHFEMVRNDTRKVFEHLVHDKTIVVWHDYARNPENIRYEVMAGILEGTPPMFHDKIRHVAHTLCAVYFPEPPEGGGPGPNTTPEGYFQVDLKYKTK